MKPRRLISYAGRPQDPDEVESRLAEARRAEDTRRRAADQAQETGTEGRTYQFKTDPKGETS